MEEENEEEADEEGEEGEEKEEEKRGKKRRRRKRRRKITMIKIKTIVVARSGQMPTIPPSGARLNALIALPPAHPMGDGGPRLLHPLSYSPTHRSWLHRSRPGNPGAGRSGVQGSGTPHSGRRTAWRSRCQGPLLGSRGPRCGPLGPWDHLQKTDKRGEQFGVIKRSSALDAKPWPG